MQPTLNGLEKLTLARYRFYLEAQQPSRLSAYKGSMLRGTAMYAFKRLYCERPHGHICQEECVAHTTCQHGLIFETPAPDDSYLLGRQTYAPRPYVIWDRNDRWRDYQPGDTFSFELMLAGTANNALPAFALAFQRASERGFGRPGRWQLTKITAISPQDNTETLVYRDQFLPLDRQALTFGYREAQAWADQIGESRALQLRFLSPTRLTYDQEWVQEPEFHIIVRTLLRRLSLLSEVHGAGPWWPDLAFHLIEQAEATKMVHAEIQPVAWERHSARSGAMKLMGITGDAWYQGDLTPVLPFLWLGQFIHIGKAYVFGNGRYQIIEPTPATKEQHRPAIASTEIEPSQL